MKDETDYPDIEAQKRFWNTWNHTAREGRPLDGPTERRSKFVLGLARELSQGGPIIDIGCGTGWLCNRLSEFAKVTGTDLAFEVVERSQAKYPHVQFSGGDFMDLEFPMEHFELAVCMETIAHVVDQGAFLSKINRLLRPNGWLILTTQNPFVWYRSSILGPPGEGQIRNWPNKKQIASLVAQYFDIESISTLAPGGDKGILKIINGRLVSGSSRRIIGRERLDRLKEQIGFGQSIAIVARKPE